MKKKPAHEAIEKKITMKEILANKLAKMTPEQRKAREKDIADTQKRIREHQSSNSGNFPSEIERQEHQRRTGRAYHD